MVHSMIALGSCTMKLNATKHNTTFPLQLIVMDLAGPVKPQSLGGGHYILNILDIFTRYSWTMVLKSKDKVAENFMPWKPVVEMQSGTQVHVMRTDSGGEFIPHAFKAWLFDKGVTI